MKEERNNKLVVILVAIIAVLVLFMLYLLAVRPSINGYAVKNYNFGIQDAVVTIMRQAAQCQQVPLTFQNQTMNMIWVDCLK